MSYESHKYYNGNLYAKDVKNQQLFIDLHAGKNQQLLRSLYSGITMVITKLTSIMKPICRYCNGCKKINNYYEAYIRVLEWL